MMTLVDSPPRSQTPFFSVIIPTFNRRLLLEGALKSIWMQRSADYEVIVVDDGSTDGTMDYLQSLRVGAKIVYQPNQGPGAARNRGARHAGGDYLAFLDSDDLWFPWTLDIYRYVIQKYGYPSFIAGRPHLFSDANDLETVLSATGYTEVRCQQFVDYIASADQWRWWGSSSFVIRRDAFVAVEGFTDEWINGEDADLALRLGVAHNFVQITAPVTFAYREHAASAMKDVKRTLAGSWFTVRAEQLGRYPGGAVRAAERHQILTRLTRPVTLGCLQQGLRREAWKLYGATFAWHISLGRAKYLAAFPLLAAMSYLRSTGAAGTKSPAARDKHQAHNAC
jgi:hypothetical protein